MPETKEKELGVGKYKNYPLSLQMKGSQGYFFPRV